MTFNIPKSLADSISKDFRGEVEAYRQSLLDHRYCQEARQPVAGKKAIAATPAIKPTKFRPGKAAKPGRAAIAPVKGIEGHAPPTAHPLIERCIKRVQKRHGPDDFVTDYNIVDDTPKVPEPTLKDKKRLLMHKVNVAASELADRVMPEGKRMFYSMQQSDILNTPEGDRTSEQNKLLTEIRSKFTDLEKINRKTSELFFAIEDLTDDNISQWKFEF